MKLFASLLLALVSVAGAGRCELLDDPDQVVTRAGVMETFSNEARPFQAGVRIGDRELLVESKYYSFRFYARVGDFYLIMLNTGGNGCPAMWIWLHAVPGDLRLSPEFGNCSEFAEVSGDEQNLIVTLPPFDPAGMTVYLYDGEALTERVAGQGVWSNLPVLGGLLWGGRSLFDIFRRSDWLELLVALLGERTYRHVGGMVEMASPMIVDGDWMAGVGRGSYVCPGCAFGLAIHRNDRRLLVVIRDGDIAEMFGDPRGPVPNLLRELLGYPPA